MTNLNPAQRNECVDFLLPRRPKASLHGSQANIPFYKNSGSNNNNNKLNSVALVREQTIPTERPPLVGEVSANF
jgi:hypothetical protein